MDVRSNALDWNCQFQSVQRFNAARPTALVGFGEMAERSKALDWNSSNIFTGVPGFESLSLRQKQEDPPREGLFVSA